jgi:phage baseplate assembly protein gpV
MNNAKRGTGFLSLLQQHANDQASGFKLASTGYVTSFNGSSCKVMLEPSGIETGWLPICMPYVGNGFGFIFDIEENTECTVVFENGNSDDGKIVAFHYEDDIPPSITPGSGSALFQHKSGSSILFNKDGSIAINAPGGISIKGTVTSTGDMTAGNISLEKHVHGGVESGSSNTSGPQ